MEKNEEEKHRKGKTIICFCEDVSKREIVEAIEGGYTTPEAIKRHLRCGMGACQGRGCMRQIAKLIARKTGQPPGNLELPTARPPIKPLPLGLAALEKEEDEEEEGDTHE